MAGMACIVALAAVGRVGDASDRWMRWRRLPGAVSRYRMLAEALAPWAPRLATAVLVDTSQRSWLLHALANGGFVDKAELPRVAPPLSPAAVSAGATLLLRADAPASALALEAVNTLLSTCDLAPVRLHETSRAPSAINLCPGICPTAVVDGPLVSILMTTFNSADRVAHALRGLLGQTWHHLEIVVVDDASTDATAAVVRALAAQDARVKFIQLPRNVGTYAAKTIGYHHASGDFITCHDSDDWSHPQRIERQMVPLMKDARLVATMSSWVRITDDGQFYARGVYPLIRLNPASALFRRREVEARAGLWDAVRTGADSEFNARLPLVFGPRAIGRVKALLTFGAHREGSLMTASDTGYSPQGLSPARLAYTEAWTLWHIAELRAGRVPRMPDARSGERPFALPPGATPVSAEVVKSAMAGAALG